MTFQRPKRTDRHKFTLGQIQNVKVLNSVRNLFIYFLTVPNAKSLKHVSLESHLNHSRGEIVCSKIKNTSTQADFMFYRLTAN